MLDGGGGSYISLALGSTQNYLQSLTLYNCAIFRGTLLLVPHTGTLKVHSWLSKYA